MAKSREQVALDLIDSNPWQPRQDMNPDDLQELAYSIQETGLLQVPLARPVQDGRFELAFGHRRIAACRLLFREGQWGHYVDLDVEDLSDEKMAVIALSENVQRKQLTSIEVVKAHRRAIDETSLSVQALADQIGMSRPALANNLRVLELPAFVLEHVENGNMGLTVAREFLVLQNSDHAHTNDMRLIIERILDNEHYPGAPDWSRRNVRRLIGTRVRNNEKDWRPLGSRPDHHFAGESRQPSFDGEVFAADLPFKLHTIPAISNIANYEGRSIYDGSRLWTCDVKEWSRRQSRATREANQNAAAASKSPASTSSTTPSREEQLRQVLATDPVWKRIAKAREKTGPDRPVTDEEREQLGTRAELTDVNWDTKFWKVLQKGRPDDSRDWNNDRGGHVAPFFPDLKECQRCTIGATYAKSRSGYPLSKLTLVCLNREHYQEKLQAGEANYRAKLEAHQKGIHRQDRETAMHLVGELQPLSEAALRVLATSLLATTEKFELQHPFRSYHADWSYEAGATARARELLGMERMSGAFGAIYLEDTALEALERVEPGDLRELVANLMVHHLRLAGKLDVMSQRALEPVSQETAIHVADK